MKITTLFNLIAASIGFGALTVFIFEYSVKIACVVITHGSDNVMNGKAAVSQKLCRFC